MAHFIVISADVSTYINFIYMHFNSIHSITLTLALTTYFCSKKTYDVENYIIYFMQKFKTILFFPDTKMVY